MPTKCKQTETYQDRIIKELEAAASDNRHDFNQFEDDCIKKYYPIKQNTEIARILGKTPYHIKKRAQYLGVKKAINKQERRWNEKENKGY